MTTIAWDGRYLAADGRRTSGCTIISDEDQKLNYIDDKTIMAGAGAVPDLKKLAECVKSEKDHEGLDAVAVIIRGNDVLICGCPDGGYWEEEINHCRAYGTGTDHAYTAMDLGQTAMQAVEMAIKRDVNSGGAIIYFDTEEPKKGIQEFNRV